MERDSHLRPEHTGLHLHAVRAQRIHEVIEQGLGPLRLLGGIARHDEELKSIKDEVRQTIIDVRNGLLKPGEANAMFIGLRFLRELEVEDRDIGDDGFILSIRSLRESGDVPDLSEPTNGGGDDNDNEDFIARTAREGREAYEDEIAERGRIDTAPLSELNRYERRQRLAGKRQRS